MNGRGDEDGFELGISLGGEMICARTVMIRAALPIAALLASSGARAADQAVVAPAPNPANYWDFHGDIEAGGRVFIQRPPLGPPPGPFGPPATTPAQARLSPATLVNPPLDPNGAGSGRGKF